MSKKKNKITVNRNSIHPADDVESHKKDFFIPDDCDTFEKLFRFLDKKNFFPKPIKGNQEIWVCRSEKRVEIFYYNRKTDQIYNSLVDMRMDYQLEKGDYQLFFTCYTPEKRAEEIFRMCNGSSYYMYHDGWIKEYTSYNIPEEVEENWRKKYGFK